MPPASDEVVVVAFLGDLAVAQDEDAVGVADGGEAVGDDEGGAAGDQRAEVLLDGSLGLRVHRAGGLVEDEDGRVLDDGAAIERRWRWPPESFTPRSPTSVS